MAGHKKWGELRKKMSPEQRQSSDAKLAIMKKAMLLAELRKYTGMTQKQLAARLGITQPGLSRIESQDDMHIATLRKLISAIGGKLELIVHMPDGEDVSLKQFAENE